MSNDVSPRGDIMFFATLKMMLLVILANDVMFAIKCGEATHHSRSVHHKAKPTSFAIGKHHSKSAPLSVTKVRSTP
jgi:hypothetical protein